MKKFFIIFFICSVTFWVIPIAWATSYFYDFTLVPNDFQNKFGDNGLDHDYYYSWGINWVKPSNETIISASITYYNIRNWDNNPNSLYTNLLNTVDSGLKRYGPDNQAGGNNFRSWPGGSLLLDTLTNATTNPVTYTINFDSTEINTFNLYASSQATGKASFGFGIDPDCHYYFDRIEFRFETDPPSVPEPATILLFGAGLLGLMGYGRKKFFKK